MIDFKVIEGTFGDAYIQAFFYDIFNKRIELHYEGYHAAGYYKEIPCMLVIENWNEAYSMPYDADVEYSKRKKFELDRHMGVFFMIMGIKGSGKWFEITINTIDERYVTYLFENPQLRIVEK